jgi:hypothetical protein
MILSSEDMPMKDVVTESIDAAIMYSPMPQPWYIILIFVYEITKYICKLITVAKLFIIF